MSENILKIAAKVSVTQAEGPGKRFAIWVQGCPFRCPGCCNPQYLAFEDSGAGEISPQDLAREIVSFRPEIEGVTLIGGEPFSQAKGLAVLAESVRKAGLSVMAFSGFTLDQLNDPKDSDFESRQALLAEVDLLIDGQYRSNEHITDRRWIGSANQKVHFLTERYLELKHNWPRSANTIEIRFRNGELTINGFPHPEITRKNVQLVKR